MKKGLITHIQRMSLHDGDGIRTTVFLKGCDFRCRWCHNPETFSPRKQLEWVRSSCLGCGKCIVNCPSGALSLKDGIIVRSRSLCSLCLKCVDSCFAMAHRLVGEEWDADDLCARLCEDRMVFDFSGGGVTFSGGEPMMQFPFLLELCMKLHEKGINVCVQTNLNAEWGRYEDLAPYVDFFMCDFKHIDAEAHRRWTGCTNEKVMENVRRLDDSGFPYCLRTPVIPGVNDDEGILAAMSDFAHGLKNMTRYELLPFHPLASCKYDNLGMDYPFEKVPQTPKDVFAEWKRKFEINNGDGK